MKNQPTPSIKIKHNLHTGKIQPKNSITHPSKVNEFKESTSNNADADNRKSEPLNISNYNFNIEAWKELCSEEIKSRLINFVNIFKLKFVRDILKVDIITTYEYSNMKYDEQCNYYLSVCDAYTKFLDTLKINDAKITKSINFFDKIITHKKNKQKKNNIFMDTLLNFNFDETLLDEELSDDDIVPLTINNKECTNNYNNNEYDIIDNTIPLTLDHKEYTDEDDEESSDEFDKYIDLQNMYNSKSEESFVIPIDKDLFFKDTKGYKIKKVLLINRDKEKENSIKQSMCNTIIEPLDHSQTKIKEDGDDEDAALIDSLIKKS